MAMLTTKMYTDSEANKVYNLQDFLGKLSKQNGSSIQVDPETCVVSMAPNQLKDGEWVLMFKYKSKTGRNLTTSETFPSCHTALAQLSMIIKSLQQAVAHKNTAFNSCVERVNHYRVHYLALSQDKLKKRYQTYMLKMLAKGIPPDALAKIIEQKLHLLIHSPINTNKVPYADYLGLMGATATEEPRPSTFERRQRDTNPYSADGPNRDRIRTESGYINRDYAGAAPVQLSDEVVAARYAFSPPLIPLYSVADRVERSETENRFYWSDISAHVTAPPQPPVPENEEE